MGDTAEGLPGGVRFPLFPMKIYSCSLVPQKLIKVFPEIHFYWVPLFPEIPLHVPLITKNIPRCSLQFLRRGTKYLICPRARARKIREIVILCQDFVVGKAFFPCYTLKKCFQWSGNQRYLVPDYNSTVPLFPKSYFKISLVPISLTWALLLENIELAQNWLPNCSWLIVRGSDKYDIHMIYIHMINVKAPENGTWVILISVSKK